MALSRGADHLAVGPELRRLAGLWGVQTGYLSAQGRFRHASAETLLAVLGALGAPVAGASDVGDALRERQEAAWTRPLEPVVLAWEGRMRGIAIRLPAERADGPFRGSVHLEGGGERRLVEAGRWIGPATSVLGRTFAEVRVAVRADPPELPLGYHRLDVRVGTVGGEAMLISAPRRAGMQPPRTWGVFLPLYALRSARSWGIGDLTDLAGLLEWTGSLGGSLVATLPLLAPFRGGGPFEPSPYSPASRLFWNDLYLDVDGVPEVRSSPRARTMTRSPGFRRLLERLRSAELVDYPGVMDAKRRVLEAAAGDLLGGDGGDPARRRALAASERADPRVRDYAAFMAAAERHGKPWQTWPARERDGRLARDGGNPTAWRYHRFVQWQLGEQLDRLGARARAAGSGLYVDFPVGVHPAGYDAWRERDAFVPGASAGAAPDPFFTDGQDWGFHPLHPEGIREQGYRYLAECFRRSLSRAGVLRIDHVMGLHRLWFVPRGMPAAAGAYVRYRPEELYAVLALEARRGEAVIVGEDLGTVSQEVRRAMDRHAIFRSYVVQYEVRDDPRRPLGKPPTRSLAAMNTHDMPPFAAFWRGGDLIQRLEQGWLDEAGAEEEARIRARERDAMVAFLRTEGRLTEIGEPSARAVLRACLRWLAAGDARMVVVSLEDLWGERRPQNVPGTTDRFPNWRRPARHPLERLGRVPGVTGTLRSIDRLRRGVPGP